MKRLLAAAFLAVPLIVAASSSFAINCGSRVLVIINDGSVIGKEVCAGASDTPWPNWLIGWFM